MNGDPTKYYKYENTSGKVNISNKVANTLNWSHKDEVRMVVKVIEGQIGLFIFKEEKEE